MAKTPLSQTHPALADMWHPTLNGDLTPDKVSAGSEIKIWWIEVCGHISENQVKAMARRAKGCPQCLILSNANPELSKEWHPTLNGNQTPDKFSIGSNEIVWWLGKCGHTWDSVIYERAKGGGCPFCSNHRVLNGFNDLATKFPEIAQEWHPTLNGDLKPIEVIAGSREKAWWLGKCGHTWEAQIGSRAMGRGCRYCSGNEVLKGFNDLATKFPDIASQWDYEKNLVETPETITSGSRGKYWWICPVGHSWIASVSKRTSGSGCGVCRNLTFVPGVNDLATIRPDIASQWDYEKNEPLTPQQVGPGSEIKVWWRCSLGHSFDSNIDSRCRDGKGCRICAGRELLVGFNDLLTRHPELAQEWHPTKNGTLKPEEIHGGQPTSYWWLGKCGHEWKANLSNRASRGAGCPKCSPGGYNSVDPGILYFIHNPKLLAFKVGITNPSSKNNRLKMFRNNGWLVVETWEHNSGRLILDTETRFFNWLRREMDIPQMLDRYTMNALQGASETFSDSLISKRTVITKIEELLTEFEE
jgi:hypothetical protein